MRYTDKTSILWYCIILLFINVNNATGDELEHVCTFSSANISLQALGEYTRVELTDCDLTEAIGKPQLPEKIVRLALPAKSSVMSVTYRTGAAQEIASDILIYPAQPPQPYSLALQTGEEISFTEPDQTVYESDEIYPGEVVQLLGQGSFAGFTIVEIAVRPVVYKPQPRRLLFYAEIELSVEFNQEMDVPSSNRQLHQNNDYLQLLKALIDNKAAINTVSSQSAPLARQNDQNHFHEYVIITPEELCDYFQPLADWKYQKGLSATIITTEFIYNNYSGKDNAEKMRNFLLYAHANWNTNWVLLGGDTNYLPYRSAFAMDCGHGASANAIPCDLYFADLQGTWDLNLNDVYGEVQDSTDLYPDLYIGRASVSSKNEAEAFVNKVLTYEINPPLGYQNKTLFAAEILWGNPYTNSGIGKDLIDYSYVPDHVQITKLYEALGNENATSVINAINDGQNLINHDGHANFNVMCVGTNNLYINTMDGLNNGPYYSILYSIGCYPGNFEVDCIAEHYVNNPVGGGVAFIGNSRYGWGSPGNPKYGYSNRFDQQFYKFLFQENITHLGQTLAMAKAYYVPYSRAGNVFRWCQYEIILFGDPEMPIWTNIPQQLSVNVPASVKSGECPITVKVFDEGNPIEGALVCIMNSTDVYNRGYTNAAGFYSTLISPASPAESLLVTVTSQNYMPNISKIAVVDSGIFIAYEDYTIDDTAGNIDGLINPGEEVKLNIQLKNYGLTNAEGVVAHLSSLNEFAMVIQDSVYYGDVSASSVATSSDLYTIHALNNCVEGTMLQFELAITDNNTTWKSEFVVPVSAPILCYTDGWLNTQDYGDGDKIAEPGERVEVITSFQNLGSTRAEQVSMSITSSNPDITIIDDQVNLGDIEADSSISASFSIDINAAAVVPQFPVFHFLLETYHGYTYEDSTKIVLGATGFFDDVEGASTQWNHSGINDQWHKSSRRNHSGTYSWYCGVKIEGKYLPNMDASLVSSEFYLAPQSELTFWAWYDVAVYSENGYRGDGLYVELWDGGDWVDVDFIGTGGDLPSTLMGNGWLQYKYDLSFLHENETTKIRFRFISDPDDEFEGVYVDDILVTTMLSTFVEDEIVIANEVPQTFELLTNYPNPFNPSTDIYFKVPYKSEVKIVVYNILGKVVKELVNTEYLAGIFHIEWNGTTSTGAFAPSGVYFYRLISDNAVVTKKMLLLR